MSRYKRKTIEKWRYLALQATLITLLVALLLGWFKHTSEASTSFISPLVSEVEYREVPEVEKTQPIKLKISHYWPELGGVNCANFVNGKCISKMANGKRWEENVGIAIACPRELAFGTKIRINGRVWECMDRGGMIKKEGDVFWIDMLTPYSLMSYGSIISGEIIL